MTRKMIDTAKSGNYVQFQKAVKEVMKQKMPEVIQQQRRAIAQKMFFPDRQPKG